MGEIRDDSGDGDDGLAIEFVPASNSAALPAERAPTWLAASIALTLALLLGVTLAVRPAQAVAHGAVGGAAVEDTPTHGDLFQLPEWHDDTPASPDRVVATPQAVADAN